MNKGRVAVLAAVSCGLLGATVACSAVLGIADFTAGDGGTSKGDASKPADGATDDGGGGDDGGTGLDGGGIHVTCDTQDGGAGALGCPCTGHDLGCNGYAQSEKLVCTNGVWADFGSCASGDGGTVFCDTRAASQGMCAAVDPNCASATPGQQVCVGSDVVQCGPDLVSETPVMTCPNACIDGQCGGTCAPGATQCTAGGAETCTAQGVWSAASACSELCSDGGCQKFASCQGGGPGADTSCGPGSSGEGGVTNDCCSSYEVAGSTSTFYRSYDDVSPGDMSKNAGATVDGFRLDAYEVTVGRFRGFTAAVNGGWLPASGSGKHTHLNGGSGLMAVGVDGGGFEPGWSSSWNSNLTADQNNWDMATVLACDSNATWMNPAAGTEHRPIGCATWYEAYAFCIWDGGFLPSEAEWNYAASGGTDQRVFPWSTVPTDTSISCAQANVNLVLDGGAHQSCVGRPNDVGSESPAGDGLFLQSDLAGNVFEWTLDSFAGYVTIPSCNNCANLGVAASRVTRGGSFDQIQSLAVASYRNSNAVTARAGDVGFRCARVP